MVTGIKSWLSGIKWFLINSISIVRTQKFKTSKSPTPIVYFILDDNPYDRYLYHLFMLFEINGYHVSIQYRFGFLKKWATSLVIKGNRNVFFSWTTPHGAHPVFSDRDLPNSDFVLRHDYFNAVEQGHYLPMPMIDSFYIYNYHELTKQMSKNNDRTIGVFFAGNFANEGYHRQELHKYFNCFNRTTLLSLIKHNFTEILHETTANLLQDDLRSKLVIIDRGHSNVEPDDLTKVLSRSNFFMCFSGVVMPLCHNVIEAMAFGAIPILQYSHLFHPPLENDVNCLAFYDEASLQIVIRKAMSMDEKEILGLRQNVIAYYERHLSPGITVRNLLKSKEKNVFIIAENESVSFLRKKILFPFKATYSEKT